MHLKEIDIISLGCSKNLVDVEGLMYALEEMGYRCVFEPKRPQGEIAIINTCGFIGDAKEESIQTILQFAQRKQNKSLKKLYVMGCLSERYLHELEAEIPEVDKWYGKFNYYDLLQELTKQAVDCVPSFKRKLTTPSHYTYLKISEGCNRFCAFCQKIYTKFCDMKQITALGVLLQYPKGALFLKDYKAKNIRNVVFAGHASAGKTSLVEAAYYLTGKSDRLGTIAEGNTVSDFDPEEIRRKSSISASIVPCEWKDVKLNIIDTPGQFDFSASVSEGFRAAGSSVIVISGKSGLSVGAQKAFDSASKKGIAKIFFINKARYNRFNIVRNFFDFFT